MSGSGKVIVTVDRTGARSVDLKSLLESETVKSQLRELLKQLAERAPNPPQNSSASSQRN